MTTTITLDELTGDFALDTTYTRIGFVAKHTMGSRVRGEFGDFTGTAHLDADPAKFRAELTLRTHSIDTGNEQRDGLLRDKFLHADTYPTLTFLATAAARTGATTLAVTGDLIIRSVRKPVTVEFELSEVGTGPGGSRRIQLRGATTIDRNDWGVNWNAATGLMVSKKVTLDFEVIALGR
ncbi:YceI family protein [Nocardia sp. NPDC050406]|uniref:YceI family protein n=1 Tax=Nocardia sp. NPDC050406 TaxID=3364318 RepID=UPI0037ADBA9F